MDLYRSPKNLFVAGFIGSPRMNFLPALVQQTAPGSLTVSIHQTFFIDLPFDPGATQPGDRVTIGVRPEHLVLGGHTGFTARILTVEHLGSESFLHLSADSGEALTARVTGETNLRPDDELRLSLDPASVHLFDESGLAFTKSPQTQSI